MTRADVITSIHDVTPRFHREVDTLWRLARAHGATPALFVVPTWHGEWPVEEHHAFVEWLHDRVTEGADVLLHGLRHDEHGLVRHWRDSARAFGRTNREGEFLALCRERARERIDSGLATLRSIDLDPIGFVPPAWLMRHDALHATADAGLALSEDVARIYVLRGARPALGGRASRIRIVHAAAWRWSARTRARAWGSAVVARVRESVLSSRSRAGHATRLRLALHPQDLAHPATRSSIERSFRQITPIARWQRYRELVTPFGAVDDA